MLQEAQKAGGWHPTLSDPLYVNDVSWFLSWSFLHGHSSQPHRMPLNFESHIQLMKLRYLCLLKVTSISIVCVGSPKLTAPQTGVFEQGGKAVSNRWVFRTSERVRSEEPQGLQI